MKKLLIIPLLLFVLHSFAQELRPIRITGLIIDAETGDPVPYASVQLKGRTFGTSTDVNGNFNILMQKTDTLIFSSIGYEKAYFTPVTNLDKSDYTLLQLLVRDTLELEEVTVFPWPDWNDFQKAFLKEIPPAGPVDHRYHVQREIDNISKKEYETNKFMYDQMRYQRLYDLNGIIPPNNFLNPVNWTNFIYELQKSRKNKK